MALTKEQMKNKFKAETKTIMVEAWGGEVEIKKLTIAEKQASDEVMLKDVSVEDAQDGKLEISINQKAMSDVIAVSHALVQPKYKVEELLTLPDDAMAGVLEIRSALDEWDTPKKSKAGK